MPWPVYIVGALFFIAFGVGTIGYSLKTGRLVYRGTQHITRRGEPFAFWGWIGFCAFVCLAALVLPFL